MNSERHKGIHPTPRQRVRRVAIADRVMPLGGCSVEVPAPAAAEPPVP